MIQYIVSYQYSKPVTTAIEESGQLTINGIVEARFSIADYVKQKLDAIQAARILIMDLSMMTDDKADILQAIQNIRIIYDNIRVIVLAPGYETGNELLSSIFKLGIYNIIASENEAEIKEEVLSCILSGRAYKDSLRFMTETQTEETKGKPGSKLGQIAEKIIIKSEVIQNSSKVMIGVMGTMCRSGTTHQAILSANYLKNKGFSVALLEHHENENLVFESIRDFNELEINQGCFSMNRVDYYPDFDLANINLIFYKNYNFIVIDFGVIRPEIAVEYNRCNMQLVVSCSKPWEVPAMDKVFKSVNETILKQYHYLFNFTDSVSAELLKEQMDELKNVYFTEYTPDPFSTTSAYPELKKLFKEFVSEEVRGTKQEKGKSVTAIIKGFGGLLKK